MADEPATRGKWFWLALIAIFAVLLIVWLFNPAGETEGDVEDPIVIEDVGLETPSPAPVEMQLPAQTPAPAETPEAGETASEPLATGE